MCVWNLQCNELRQKVHLHLLSTKYQPGIKKIKEDNCLHRVQAMLLGCILLWDTQALIGVWDSKKENTSKSIDKFYIFFLLDM